MTPPRIQLLVFEALQANAGADFVCQLVEAFADEAPGLVVQLHRAAAAGDAAAVETMAHTLKSNGVAFGAARLSEMAGRLEWQGQAADRAAIDQLAAEVELVVPQLRALAHR
ncbi:MAG: Hpt domain-containing protein [Aquabacterium sp.]